MELSTTGLSKASDLLDGNVDIWKTDFSMTGSPISILAEKHDLKPEFLLLKNIVAKALLAKVEAYDNIIKEKFMFTALISSKTGFNWSHILFSTLCEITKGKGQSKGLVF